jgi:ribosome biogenesis protein ENP2
MPVAAESSRVYSVSGGGSSSTADSSYNSTSLPDLLRRHGGTNKRRPRKKAAASINEELARIELLQDFEFPEASNKITSTRDGQYIVATGTYKPQMRVWECEQLSLKFERHSDAENVAFIMLSDDWTKSLHIQNDRTVELHSQGGHHARLRIPRFGRALDYHFSSATALIGAAGNEVYRLNLEQGRFLAPFMLSEGVQGVNAVNVNPAHGLCAFGVEGGLDRGGVEMWDARNRSRAGQLSIATKDVLDAALMTTRRGLPGVYSASGLDDPALLTEAMSSLSVTALSSSSDGLNIAVGTNTGHVLLYDLRMEKPYATKDQGFGLPIKALCWPSDGATTQSSIQGDTKQVLSSDAKVIKVWSADKSAQNKITITPNVNAGDINDVHHIPGTGLIVSANEATRCSAWYVPDLGVAPKWCSFLDVLADEADTDMTGSGKGTYEDFKFVDQAELERLGLTHLIGSEVLRPYMHGFFMSLALYDRARLINNPTAYEDARERAIKRNLEKMAESRIREDPKDVARRRRNEKLLEGIRVNKELAEKFSKQEQKRGSRKKRAEGETDEADEAAAEEVQPPEKATLLSDNRFKELFTNPEFEVDENSREFALLNPSTARNKAASNRTPNIDGTLGSSQRLTAVEEEALESDRESLDPDQEESSSSSEDEADSDDEGNLGQFDPRQYVNKRRVDLERAQNKAVRGARPIDEDGDDNATHSNVGKKRSFGERLRTGRSGADQEAGREQAETGGGGGGGGGKSFTWTPSSGRDASGKATGSTAARKGKKEEMFGKGLSRGAGSEQGLGVDSLAKEDRFGREKRRKPNRSASHNVMRGRS